MRQASITDAFEPRSRRGTALIAVMALSAFGPYIISGFRTEQFAVYGITALLVCGLWWMKARPGGHGTVVLGLLFVHLAIAVVGVLAPPLNTTPYQFGSALAGIDNIALPIAVLAAVWMLLASGADRSKLIRIVCWVTAWAMVINAGLAGWATGGSGPELAIFQGQPGVESVASRAEQLGRFSGIFNQPAEAGLMYSVALLAAIFLYRERARLLAMTATLLSIGGVLTVSKVFLFVGLPLGLWQAMRSAGGRQRRVAALLAATLAVWATAKSGLTPEWTGGNFLLRLLPGSDQGTVELYTAGRFGSESTLTAVVDAVMAASPVWGFGAGGLMVAYDNAWIEALAMTGLVGAALMTAILLVLAHAWWAQRRDFDPAESRLAGGLVAVVAGAAVGLPSFTANRCATILWLLLALLLLSVRTSALRSGPGSRSVSPPESTKAGLSGQSGGQ